VQSIVYHWLPSRAPSLRSILGPLLGLFLIMCLARGETVIYSTSFEPEEGYDPAYTLIGQGGWKGYGFGGNGLVTNYLAGLGQQAYIGFNPPEQPNSFFNLYQPVNLSPIPPALPLIKFSVLMQIVDSQSARGPWDDFRWSVYNTNGHRLFSLDFDNASFLVSYVLDDNAGFISTDRTFDNQGYYQLEVSMDFPKNLWSATLNDEVIVNAKPITTTGASLNLGDIDAVWYMPNPNAPGDNYMLFDNYTVTADATPSIPPRLEPLGISSNQSYRARIYGEPALSYRVESSTDLHHWSPVLTNRASANGILDFQDPVVGGKRLRFYRAVQSN
jgi:hypothetical protein